MKYASLQIARRVQRVKPSPTLAMTARAAELRRQGKDVISLSVGEPDFDTPLHVGEAGIEAIRTGFTRYTNADGMPELKDAIIAKFQRDNELSYERNQILVSTGAKQTLFNLCMAVVDPGDEVIIPAPYWVSYPDMVMLADGLPVTPDATAEQGYKITPRQLAAAITPQTRLRAAQLAEQSHRRGLHARRARRHWARCCSSIRVSWSAPTTSTRRSTGATSRSRASPRPSRRCTTAPSRSTAAPRATR